MSKKKIKRMLSKKDVEQVAKLAKLNLTAKEISKFQKQLSEIVEYVNELSEVDVSSVEPTSQTSELENAIRADEIGSNNSLSQDEAISGTDDVHNGYFKVPMILAERTV